MSERRIPNLGLQQAYVLRNLAVAQAVTLNEEDAKTLRDKGILAKALKDLTHVWDQACDRIRIIKGRPLPGSLKSRNATSPRTRNGIPGIPSFTEE